MLAIEGRTNAPDDYTLLMGNHTYDVKGDFLRQGLIAARRALQKGLQLIVPLHDPDPDTGPSYVLNKEETKRFKDVCRTLLLGK